MGLFAAYGLAVVLAAAAAEAYVRLTSRYGFLTPEMVARESISYEPAVFARHVLLPESRTVVFDRNVPGIRWHINSLGYRGREFSRIKQAGVTRVLVYGGSAVFDMYLPDPNDWPHHAERLLQSQGAAKVEIVNAGIPGHATADCVGRLFAEGHLFDPDVVVLYEEWNDLKLLGSSTPLLRQLKPLQPGRFDPRTGYANVVDRFLCERSQLFVRLRYRYFGWMSPMGLEGTPVATRASEPDQLALAQYRLAVGTFVDIARRIGAHPVLMTQARLATRSNTPGERQRIGYDMQPFLSDTAVLDAFAAADSILRDAAREPGVTLIDTSQQVPASLEFFEDHVHLTPAGSMRVASSLAEGLVPLLKRSTDQEGSPRRHSLMIGETAAASAEVRRR